MSIIECSSISNAWLAAFDLLLTRGVERIEPLLVSISLNYPDIENVEIRSALDKHLKAKGLWESETTANTIFPLSLWEKVDNRDQLYGRYLRIVPRLKKWQPGNRYGLYFERLINYRSGDSSNPMNQLEQIIQTYLRGNRRRSALQAAIFDPAKDLNNQFRRGFPCLQYIAFSPSHQDNSLEITGVYATQYIFERAYGNYLGLYRLGAFMANAMNLHLRRIICYTSQAKLGDSENITKGEGNLIREEIRRSV